jgi:hypothetical protein
LGERWRPYRAYALQYLWAHLAAVPAAARRARVPLASPATARRATDPLASPAAPRSATVPLAA